jgi:hypothetical protein
MIAAVFAPDIGSAEQKSTAVSVVELFTSQGCSSCPAADLVAAEMADKTDTIVLSYHVDYWDYLGWRDTLASPDNSARQYEYSRALGLRSVYTPQAVVNGQVHVNGADRAALDKALAQTGRERAAPVPVTLSYERESLIIETGAAPREMGDAHVMIVYFHPETRVEIERGENSGRSFTYRNAVAGFHSAGVWHGDAARFELPLSEVAKKAGGGCAAIIQRMTPEGLPGEIVGAALLQPPNGYQSAAPRR